MKELLLGAGSNRTRKVGLNGEPWAGLVTLDMNPVHKPDVLWDLATLPYPFPDNEFDSVSAFDVMEHVGQQGDWRFFFDQWSEIWRILKPGGVFCGLSPHPTSKWAWSDPGHTRVLAPESMLFLLQPQYEQVGSSAMTDYRFCYQADFDLIHCNVDEDKRFTWILGAVKPSRVKMTDQAFKDWLDTIPEPIEPANV